VTEYVSLGPLTGVCKLYQLFLVCFTMCTLGGFRRLRGKYGELIGWGGALGSDSR
jgi:hypothetical protein